MTDGVKGEQSSFQPLLPVAPRVVHRLPTSVEIAHTGDRR